MCHLCRYIRSARNSCFSQSQLCCISNYLAHYYGSTLSWGTATYEPAPNLSHYVSATLGSTHIQQPKFIGNYLHVQVWI